MRTVFLADVHGNLAALEAVVAEVDRLRPDLVVHGGDLAFNGPRPAECVDLVRERGWPGVMGNMDEAIWSHPGDPKLARTGELLGEERVAWLRELPLEWKGEGAALVHAVPGDLWTAVFPDDASDERLREVYGPLGEPLAVYCHIHIAYVRELDGLTVANTGSVGLPFDRDPRASFLVVEDGRPRHVRVEYDLERELADLEASGYPGWRQIAEAQRTGVRP